jgi:hypothetical protein
MPEDVDGSSAFRFERISNEYSPLDDPNMRRIIVKAEPVPGVEVKFGGFKTDNPGAIVDLQALAENNKTRRKETRDSSGRYEQVYFTTKSGSIYHVRYLEDGTWEVEQSKNTIRTIINEPCTIEVGRSFVSPNLIGGHPYPYTTTVQEIILVDENTKPSWMGAPISQEETDIAMRFTKAKQNPGTT